MGDFRKKNYRADFERKNVLQENTFHKMALYVGEKKFHHHRFQGKKILISLTNDHRTSKGRHFDVQL